MTAKTTTDMLDVLAKAATALRKIDDDLSAVMPTSIVEKFEEAMRCAGVEPARSDEYFSSLTRATEIIREDLDRMLRELGSAQHIISAGVHKAINRTGNHLVL
jgi:hypothetical protein